MTKACQQSNTDRMKEDLKVMKEKIALLEEAIKEQEKIASLEEAIKEQEKDWRDAILEEVVSKTTWDRFYWVKTEIHCNNAISRVTTRPVASNVERIIMIAMLSTKGLHYKPITGVILEDERSVTSPSYRDMKDRIKTVKDTYKDLCPSKGV